MSTQNSNKQKQDTVLTVIMPAFNEEVSIRLAVQEIQKEVLDNLPEARLNGSK